jgi:hypothetical protein
MLKVYNDTAKLDDRRLPDSLRSQLLVELVQVYVNSLGIVRALLVPRILPNACNSVLCHDPDLRIR